MSLRLLMRLSHMCSFPRVSGDEPKAPYTPTRWDVFSPRERGGAGSESFSFSSGYVFPA